MGYVWLEKTYDVLTIFIIVAIILLIIIIIIVVNTVNHSLLDYEAVSALYKQL